MNNTYSLSIIVYHSKGVWRTGRTAEGKTPAEAKQKVINDPEFKGQTVIVTSCRKRKTNSKI